MDNEQIGKLIADDEEWWKNLIMENREKATKACEKRGYTVLPYGFGKSQVVVKCQDDSIININYDVLDAWIEEDFGNK